MGDSENIKYKKSSSMGEIILEIFMLEYWILSHTIRNIYLKLEVDTLRNKEVSKKKSLRSWGYNFGENVLEIKTLSLLCMEAYSGKNYILINWIRTAIRTLPRI
jgi:hypothetical protein